MMRKLFLQTSHYSIGSFLTTLLSLVSFPFFTRIFTVAEYGIITLLGTTLTILVAMAKVGLQHSVVRYYSETVSGKRPFGIDVLYSTALVGMAGTGFLVAAGWAGVVQVLPASWLGDAGVRGLFMLLGVIVLSQTVASAMVNFLRAELRSARLVTYQVATKYVGLAVVIGALLFFSRDLWTYYTATAITDVAGTVLLWYLVFGRGSERPRPSRDAFSWPLFRELLHFGLPMMLGHELSNLILSMGDRYVIQALLGAAPLGIYAASYTLCQYVHAVLVSSMGQSIMPIYLRLWEEKGEAATVAFIERSLGYYVIIGTAVVAGLTAVGPPLLSLLASEKYASGAVIIPWVCSGIILQGAAQSLAAGLYIHRRTQVIMRVLIACAALNLVLNYLLIPHLGIVGSAVATLLGGAILSGALAFAARPLLRVRFPWGTLARAGASSLVMYHLVTRLDAGSPLATLFVRMAAGAACYGLLVLAIDRPTRDAALLVARRLKGRFRPS
jgi:O-antigen/teichoic acid export membrane protein